MIITLMALKGIATLLATKGVAILAVKSVLAFGVAATLKGLLVAGVVVGGVSWTNSRVKDLSGLIDALEEGDEVKALKKLASLAKSLHGVDLDGISALPSELGAYLDSIGADYNVKNAIVDYAQENLAKL